MVKDPIPLGEVRRALVVKLRHHGDVLLSSPIFSVLKAQAPHIEIDALVYADTAAMLTLHPAIACVHTIDRRWKKLGLFRQGMAEWGLLKTLRARRYDLVIHLTEHPRGAWLARLCRARWAVAPLIKQRGRFWNTSFTHLFARPANALRHTVECNLDALRRIGVYPEADARGLTLVAGTDADTRVEALLRDHKLIAGEYIHIHPASRWLFKCWPAAQVAQLIERLHAEGHAVVLSAAPDATETAMIGNIQSLLSRPAVSLAGQLSLKELAALTARARAFVGVDSAPMHIAAAVGTPCVALFGPSGDKEWGPWGVPCRVVASEAHPCRPCGIDGCGGGKVSDCLLSLTPDTVFAALKNLLDEPREADTTPAPQRSRNS